MAFTRDWIIEEIQRVAKANGGVAPGRMVFERTTGIRESDWLGRFWARWSDAIREAGLTPNVMQGRLSDEDVIRKLADETRRLGRFPALSELRLRAQSDPTFPSHSTFASRGNRAALIRLTLEFCKGHDDYADVLGIVSPLVEETPTPEPVPSRDVERIAGYVYLVKSGKFYKVGFSTDVQRRMLQLNTGMPETGELVHTISTDDPAGIERYWHMRFAERRLRPDAEWFGLTAEDVRAFKRRRFQ